MVTFSNTQLETHGEEQVIVEQRIYYNDKMRLSLHLIRCVSANFMLALYAWGGGVSFFIVMKQVTDPTTELSRSCFTSYH